jgi:hypothetical protein
MNVDELGVQDRIWHILGGTSRAMSSEGETSQLPNHLARWSRLVGRAYTRALGGGENPRLLRCG